MWSALRYRARLPPIRFFSSSAKMSPIIPPHLSENVKAWTLYQTKEFFEANKELIESSLLSESDFLKLRLPPLNYIHQFANPGTRHSVYSVTPQSVVPCDGFKDEVNNATWDDTPKYFQPRFVSCAEIFDEDVNQVLRLIIEAKTKWALSGVDDLVAAYAQSFAKRPKRASSKTSVYRQVRQLFGYLSYNELRYGSLTTYDKTWFTYRPPTNPGQLCVSPPIPYDNQQPTLFQCFAYLTALARKGHTCASALLSSPPPGNDKGGSLYGDGELKPKKRGRPPKSSKEHSTLVRHGRSGQKNASPSRPLNREKGDTTLDFFDWGSFTVLDDHVLGHGRTGTVFKADLRGEIVALIISDLWKHPDYEEKLINEVKVYHALKDLQGDCIPRFKGAGYTAGGLFAVATDIAGEALEHAESLSDEERLAIQRAMSKIHRHGFVHNDIRLDNILIKRDDHQFYVSIVDFTFSKRGCQQDFQEEMEDLINLLESRLD